MAYDHIFSDYLYSEINAYIVFNYIKITEEWKKQIFIKLLEELVRPHMERWATNPKMPREIWFFIRKILNIPEIPLELLGKILKNRKLIRALHELLVYVQ